MAFEQCQRQLAQQAKVLGPMTRLDATVVFAEGDIQLPVEIVFDAPVVAQRVEFCPGDLQLARLRILAYKPLPPPS